MLSIQVRVSSEQGVLNKLVLSENFVSEILGKISENNGKFWTWRIVAENSENGIYDI